MGSNITSIRRNELQARTGLEPSKKASQTNCEDTRSYKSRASKFFTVLDSTMKSQKIDPLRVYNMDESSLNTVQSTTQKVLALKGKKQVGYITSAERSVHCTIVCCMSSAGTFIPPRVIFLRKRWKPELGDSGPPETLNLCQENGWMTGELFQEWLKHFVTYAAPSSDNKVLLLLDV